MAIADCNLPQALQFKKEKNGNWDIYGSHYALLDRQDIDAVIIAGQEYQRVLPCIHAVQAGKDVYAEKPLTLYIQEGRTLVNHVRKHKRRLSGRVAATVDGDEPGGLRVRAQRRTGQAEVCSGVQLPRRRADTARRQLRGAADSVRFQLGPASQPERVAAVRRGSHAGTQLSSAAR